jgi:nucleoside-diphosphate-sugar epimerase
VRILILGGTLFLGRVLVEEALNQGHDVTTFNRGRSGIDVEGAEALRGDREQEDDLRRLSRGRAWDAVVDTSGFIPRVVRESARVLADHVDRYAFISSVSVYEGWPVEPLTETSPVLVCPSDAGPDYGYDDPRGYPTRYGFQKAGCEGAVRDFFGDRHFVLRPGVILGTYEYVGRLPWWLRRVALGGHVLAPGQPDKPIQPIDVRDVAGFVLASLHSGVTGAYNLAAPRSQTTFESCLNSSIAVTGSNAELVWIDDRFLLDHGVRQWTELPLWRTHAGTWNVGADRAQAAGLRCRPMRETVNETWAWLQRVDGDDGHSGERAAPQERTNRPGVELETQRHTEHGIASDKEQQIIADWMLRR